MEYEGDSYYYHYNLQGDVLALVDEIGEVVVEYTYDSWGNILSVTGSMASTLGVDNPFRYRGYYYDEESGLYYLNSRYYDPVTGRFVNADAYLGANGDMLAYNLFAYCSNNPINYSDPLGLYWVGSQSQKIWYTLDSRARWEMEIYEGGIANCIYIDKRIASPKDIIDAQQSQQGYSNFFSAPSKADTVLSMTASFMSIERTIITSLGSFAELTQAQSAQLAIWGYATSTPWAIGAHIADSRLTMSQKVKLVEMEVTAAVGGVVLSVFAPAGWAGVATGAAYAAFVTRAINLQAQSYYNQNANLYGLINRKRGGV